jgi:hypothetical protein
MSKPWTGKLRHSQEITDDWGCVRDESNRLIFTVAVKADHDERAEHRRNKTDPTQPIVDAIISILNDADFSDSKRLSWLIRENAYGLIDPSWAGEEDPQTAVRERIDQHMNRGRNKENET